ncbi:hypothetical protein [Ruminococcus albus]|jgi:hypothetical protein|uniref:Uncharacterized protein n=1 Tax=Ruminococcus albus (strain ATCC 27210 / DSM 20455 / JCM 14654 / NCDO 2250 / 7) TaxID=697329 RepID=E6UG97_RUMA7|nr:hypothetical protein [Ruminococcus albus]ADU21935.1 hypothetical protein Rumal_1421 [Ruminococcus albus 7 = DSM 20455]MBE6869526.1 hypothetical protein [Ruminococcus albus]
MINKKNICIISAAVLLIIFSVVFYISHKTNIKYNDWSVLGHTFDEVEQKYGKFDVDYGRKKAYCISAKNSNGHLPYDPEYYWMESDESGIIVEVYVEGKPGG